MKTAHAFAECSTARRLQVGAIVVKDNRIISIGYNGMPGGWDNNCEIEHVKKYPKLGPNTDNVIVLESKPEVLHAEMNALMKLARSNGGGNDAVMFITHSPCLDCAKGMYQAGITEVYYEKEYRDTKGIDFLKQCDVNVFHLKCQN